MKKIQLFISEIADRHLRENFIRIRDFLNSQHLLRGQWRFIEQSFTSNGTNVKIAHRLGYTPKDVIQVSLIGTGAITWNYSSFDDEDLDVTISGISGTLTVRAFVGSYRET